MLHRSIEAPETTRQLGMLFADSGEFTLHPALPKGAGDEGAANTMRICASHGAPGLEIFVYGETQAAGFPARQSCVASASIARRHGLDPSRTLLAQQSDAAIQAGAFHNDVVAVSNESVLLVHEQVFADQAQVYDTVLRFLPDATILEVPASAVSLEDAIRSYLFNAQLVTPPDGGMVLVVPDECRKTIAVTAWLTAAVS